MIDRRLNLPLEQCEASDDQRSFALEGYFRELGSRHRQFMALALSDEEDSPSSRGSGR
jgi:hypothetical protein